MSQLVGHGFSVSWPCKPRVCSSFYSKLFIEQIHIPPTQRICSSKKALLHSCPSTKTFSETSKCLYFEAGRTNSATACSLCYSFKDGWQTILYSVDVEFNNVLSVSLLDKSRFHAAVCNWKHSEASLETTMCCQRYRLSKTWFIFHFIIALGFAFSLLQSQLYSPENTISGPQKQLNYIENVSRLKKHVFFCSLFMDSQD